MEKKIFNWLGFIFIGIYSIVLLISVILGIYLLNKYLLGLSVVMLLGSIAFVPLIWHLSWWVTKLPMRRVPAKLVSKRIINRQIFVRGIAYAVPNYWISFEFSNGTNWSFNVNLDIFNAFNEGDQGILLYRGQDNRNYFVGFEKQNG